MTAGERALRRDPQGLPVSLDVVLAVGAERRNHGRTAPDLDVVLARLASEQHGVVSRAQLSALGASRAAIEHRLKRGRLLALHRGVYAVGHTALSDHSRALAALLAAGNGAVLSHRTAAWLWSLIPSMPPYVEVTVTGRRPRNRPGIVVHQASSTERTVRHRLPVTTPLQTLRDLRSRDRDRATREALVLRLVTQADADRLHPGRTVGPTRNDLERGFLRLIDRAGLDRPLVNHKVGRYELDFVWPAMRVVAETDGWSGHGHRAAFERDRARDAELTAAGYRVVRFTWRQFERRPTAVAVRLGQVLAAASSAPARHEFRTA